MFTINITDVISTLFPIRTVIIVFVFTVSAITTVDIIIIIFINFPFC
ncbi:hypothetical protein ES703_15423 [subsurface metagenome]